MVGFHRDQDGAWFAELECGHPQHVRHQPPWQERLWVTTEQGRAHKLGKELDCLYCNMPQLPSAASVYKRTPVFTEQTMPAALLSEHRTQEGVWGRIVVTDGNLVYIINEPRSQQWVLRPGIQGIIAPAQRHHIRPQGLVKFQIEFLK